jgi:hypothetical protein
MPGAAIRGIYPLPESGIGFTQICERFQMEKYSSASSVIERMKARLKKDNKLKNTIEKISNLVLKSQEQT